MAYATQADLSAAITAAGLTLLTNLDNAATDTAALGEALDWGASKIDSWAAGTPGFPWENIPERATQANVTLAIYRLYQLIWGEIPESLQREYDALLAELKQLSDGTISWVPTAPSAKQNLGKVWFVNSTDAPRSNSPRTRSRYHTRNL